MYAVKIFDDVWQYHSMHETLAGASREYHSIRRDIHRPFPLVNPKIVRPSAELVGIYRSLGNVVYQ
jgi:hypothetical protein